MRAVQTLILSLMSPDAFPQNTPLNLHELYEPSPVQFHFGTPGWYVLGSLILVTAVAVTIHRVRKYVKNRYRREALREMESLTNTPEMVTRLFVILKRTAIYAFGREQVGHLYGKEWLSFLDNTGREVYLAGYQELISRCLYSKKGIDPEEQKIILLNARNWVKTHAVKF